MKLIHFFLLIAVSLLVITACKKSDVAKAKTTAEKIQAKWQVDNYVYRLHVGGITIDSTYKGQPSDYIDFRTDGKEYSNVDNSKDTSTYTIQGDSTVNVIDNTGTATASHIQNLTDHVLTLYAKQIDSTTSPSNFDYLEVTFNLKK